MSTMQSADAAVQCNLVDHGTTWLSAVVLYHGGALYATWLGAVGLYHRSAGENGTMHTSQNLTIKLSFHVSKQNKKELNKNCEVICPEIGKFCCKVITILIFADFGTIVYSRLSV